MEERKPQTSCAASHTEHMSVLGLEAAVVKIDLKTVPAQPVQVDANMIALE